MATRKREEARENLTNSFVQKLKPVATRYSVADSQVLGLAVRVTPNGVKSFVVRGRSDDGRRIAVTLGGADALTVDAARKLAQAELTKIHQGEDPNRVKREARSKPKAVTFGDFLDTTYKKHLEDENMRARDNTLARLKSERTFGLWLKKPLTWITKQHVEAWQLDAKRRAAEADGIDYDDATTEQREAYKAVGNRHIMCLRAALSVAVKDGLLPSNPLSGYKLNTIIPEARTFTPEQQRKLFEEIDKRETRMREARDRHNAWLRDRSQPEVVLYGHFCDYVKPFVTVLFATGLRRGEALKLRWKDIDLESGRLTVPMEAAKTKRERTIPLTRTALDTLKTWRDQTESPFPDMPVFISSLHGKAIGDVKKVWNKLISDAGLPRLGLHAIRHTVATEVIGKTDLATTQKILGHSQITTTARYLHPDQDRMLKGLEGMDSRQSNVVQFPSKAEGESNA